MRRHIANGRLVVGISIPNQGLLCTNKPGIKPIHLHQPVVATLLNHTAVVHDDDSVGPANRLEAVRDLHRRPSLGRVVDCLLHHLFRFRVQRRGGFVQQQDLGVRHDGASNGNALLLAAAELVSPFAHPCAVPLWQLLNEVVRIGLLGSLDDKGFLFLLAEAGPVASMVSVQDVLKDGVVEEHWFLLDQPHHTAPRGNSVPLHIFPVELDAALLQCIPPLQQGNDGALAAAAGAHNGRDLAGGDVKSNVGEDRDGRPSRIGK
jgi:hypothetical protein